MPFDPPLSTSLDCRAEVCCPRCENTQEVPFVTLLSEIGDGGDASEGLESSKERQKGGKGYAQRGFEATCTGCGLVITRDVISCNNVAKDIARASNDIIQGKKTFLK